MDPALNPFSPGAGVQPPELAGRQGLIDEVVIALRRAHARRAARSLLILGLRGVGKTVLINRIGQLAQPLGFAVVRIEAPEHRRLAELLVPLLCQQLLRLSAIARARSLVMRALAVVQAFARAFKVSLDGLQIGMDLAPPGTADTGQLELDLPEVLRTVVHAAQAADQGLLLLIDELQYLEQEDLAALIVSVHLLAQENSPFLVIGAGLPQLVALAGKAKSYAERLFLYPELGPLEPAASRAAIQIPLDAERIAIEPAALDAIVARTMGYPYFLQEWGAHVWNISLRPPITCEDVERASDAVISDLDRNFFRARFDRLRPRERDYLRAMADLGPGPYRSGAVAERLGVRVEQLGALREGLIRKGMIYAPRHGDTAFTVPMFDDFMRRTLPSWAPASPERPREERGSR